MIAPAFEVSRKCYSAGRRDAVDVGNIADMAQAVLRPLLAQGVGNVPRASTDRRLAVVNRIRFRWHCSMLISAFGSARIRLAENSEE
jgi:hypothetical protein